MSADLSFSKWNGNGDEEAKVKEVFTDCKFRELMIAMTTQFYPFKSRCRKLHIKR